MHGNDSPRDKQHWFSNLWLSIRGRPRPKRDSTSLDVNSAYASCENSSVETHTNEESTTTSHSNASIGPFSRAGKTLAAPQHGHFDSSDTPPHDKNTGDTRLNPSIRVGRALITGDDAVAGATDPNFAQRFRDTSSNNSAPIPEPVYDLDDKIAKVMKQNKIGLQETEPTHYLPDEDRKRLVTKESILHTLGRVPDDFVQWIEEETSKTFIITVLAIRETARRFEAMNAFRFHRFKDAYLPPGQTIEIAIKTLQQVSDKGFDLEKEWRNEAVAHKELGNLNPDHIVQAIAAYKHRFQYFLLFEWADGGNLRSYWRNTDHPGFTSGMLLEYLRQLRGLTGALHAMHHTRQARSRRESQTDKDSSAASFSSIGPDYRRDVSNAPYSDQSSDYTDGDEISTKQTTGRAHSASNSVQYPPEPPELTVENVDGERATPSSPSTRAHENWRHGDIKPDNILRFTKGSSDLGILKLADLGRAKQNFLVTRNRPELEWDKWRTKPYEPPDLYIGRFEKSMSRLFDVWSLGCVFFESIVWILYGQKWLQSFSETTGTATQNETPFWTRNGNSASISPTVRACMQHVFEKDPECNGQRASAIKDLLSLVRGKMLVIDLPEHTDIHSDGNRANTEAILKDLDSIIERSGDHSYLLVQAERTNVELLPAPKRVIPSTRPEDTLQKPPNSSLAVPEVSTHGRSMTQRLNTYSNVPENRWIYENDELFAHRVYEHNVEIYNAECQELKDQVLCKSCRGVNVRSSDLLLSRKVKDLVSMCSLCTILLTRASIKGVDYAAIISLSRNETGLVIDRAGRILDHQSRLRLCRPLGDSPTANPSGTFIPFGLPRLPEIGSTASFILLRSWLDDCDKGHGEKQLDCISSQSRRYCPKRLLDVGSNVDAYHSRIVKSKSLEELHVGHVRYLALSHPWGKRSDDNPHFVSTKDNIVEHMDRILDDDLPRNFQDAVIVTRQLRIRYLWIDALCILQRTSTDPGDFQEEAGFMQDTFSSAYCVLAASSALEMRSGFLHSGDQVPRRERRAAEVNDGDAIICDSPDDFENDVINSPPSSRAWVLQERALARRTIFFTNNQIYWECSGGVRCESMSKLANSEAAFLGDSNFPGYAVKQQTKGAQIHLFLNLYADFCRLKFSHKTDKPFAISGLEPRLTQQFADTSGAGVFGKHKGRCLLWKRADGE